MKYYSQLEVEKLLECLYDRQCATVPPEQVEDCGPIQETRTLMLKFSQDNAETLDLELWNNEPKPNRRCNGNCREPRN